MYQILIKRVSVGLITKVWIIHYNFRYSASLGVVQLIIRSTLQYVHRLHNCVVGYAFVNCSFCSFQYTLSVFR